MSQRNHIILKFKKNVKLNKELEKNDFYGFIHFHGQMNQLKNIWN